jgi:hypothetical protein
VAQRSKKRSARLPVSSATIALFFLSFISSEWGSLAHSIVSLVFTAVLLFHLKNNWKVYSRSFRRLGTAPTVRGAVDTGHFALVAFVVASGMVLWIGDLLDEPHEVTGGTVTVLGIVHIWVHRRSLLRLVRTARKPVS